MKYIGGWSANGGATYMSGYTYQSLAKARKSLREICRGNVYPGNRGSWTIIDREGNEVESGNINKSQNK